MINQLWKVAEWCDKIWQIRIWKKHHKQINQWNDSEKIWNNFDTDDKKYWNFWLIKVEFVIDIKQLLFLKFVHDDLNFQFFLSKCNKFVGLWSCNFFTFYSIFITFLELFSEFQIFTHHKFNYLHQFSPLNFCDLPNYFENYLSNCWNYRLIFNVKQFQVTIYIITISLKMQVLCLRFERIDETEKRFQSFKLLCFYCKL